MSIQYTKNSKDPSCTNLTGYSDPINKRVTLSEWADWKRLVEIGSGVFLRNMELEEIVIPDTVETIGKRAFYACRNLKHVMLSLSLKNIQGMAFAYCEGLEWVTLPDSLSEIGRLAFYGCCNLKECVIPASVKKIGEGAFAGTGLMSINAPEENPFYVSRDDVLYDKEGKRLLSYPAGKAVRHYRIPDGTEEIASFAFCALGAATPLQGVTLPTSLKRIEPCAFMGTKLNLVWFNGSEAEWRRLEGSAEAFRDNMDDAMEIKFLK